MDVAEIIGWSGSIISLLSVSMRTMVPLRILAFIAAAFFIAFGIMMEIWHSVFLNACLLAFNAWRLWEIHKITKDVSTLKGEPSEFKWLRDVSRPKSYSAGELVFQKGEAPDGLYYLDKGHVMLEEIGVTLKPGDVFGEIAFFTDQRARTASARCIDDCKIVPIDEASFVSIYHNNPTFSVSIVKLIAKRLLEGKVTQTQGSIPAGG